MLRTKVLSEWNALKETIKGNQQYYWGKLLRKLGIKSLAPQLDFEQTVQEIKGAKLDSETLFIQQSSQVNKLKSDIGSLRNLVNDLRTISILSFEAPELERVRHELKQEKDYVNL